MRKSRNIYNGRIAQVITIICAGCFSVFSFLYLYCFQSELIAQEQFHFSQGETTYDPLIGSIIITALLLCIGLMIRRFVQLPIRFLALAWVPSCYLLGMLTMMHFSSPFTDLGAISLPWLILTPLFYILGIYIAHSYPDSQHKQGGLTRSLIPNCILLTFCFLLTGLIGNTDKSIHHELRMAKLIQKGQYEKAVHVGQYEVATPKLLAMRTYALLKTGRLSDEFFTYSMPAGSAPLMPNLYDKLALLQPEHGIYRMVAAVPSRHCHSISSPSFYQRVCELDSIPRPYAKQMLLVSYLMDKDLPRFVSCLQEGCDTLPISLSTSYREALILHQFMKYASTSHPVQHDEILEARFADFCLLRDTCRTEAQQSYYSKEQFGDTYWHYYFFVH